MHKNYFLIIVAAALFCLLLIFFSLWREIKSPITQVVARPTHAPFNTSIAGVGIVEPCSEPIMITSPLNRIVKDIHVTVGQKVKKGEPLFTLKNSDLYANLKAQEAVYNSSVAKLNKLESSPRPEDLTVAESAYSAAKDELASAKVQYDMVLNLPNPGAVSAQEKNQRKLKFQQAEANEQSARANLEKVKNGPWKPDLEIARHEVEEAKANVNRIQTEISQTQIRSPLDSTVLQMKVHEGELADSRTLIVLGDIDEKYLRVSINQLDIPHFNSNAPAIAYLQGDSNIAFPLKFVRLEPLLVYKKNLTNEISETVDTRVLQIIYLIEKEDPNLFVGQQMDVFIENGLKK